MNKNKKAIITILLIITIISSLLFIFHDHIIKRIFGGYIEKPVGNGYEVEKIQESNNTLDSIENSGLKPSYSADDIRDLDFYELISIQYDLRFIKSKGRLIVPSVGIDLKVYEGINKAHLASGAAEQLPRKSIKVGDYGNYILASHNTRLVKGGLFRPLINVKKDEYIHVTDEVNIYKYKIYFVDNVYYKDTSHLKQDYKKQLITLYTCTTSRRWNDYRFVVKGELVEKLKLKEK